ncbi:MAG TPA: rhodanese-like domain-containing protein [Pantanalinema sp.]
MPMPEPHIPRVTIQHVKRLMDGGASFYLMDVRHRPDSTQIKGAIYYDPDDLLAAEHIQLPVPKDLPVFLYCTSLHEGTSAAIARKLLAEGHAHVHPIMGGYGPWRRRKIGYPIERRGQEKASFGSPYRPLG